VKKIRREFEMNFAIGAEGKARSIAEEKAEKALKRSRRFFIPLCG